MFDARPGITGWAQVNGRKEVPWPQRIELNIEYVERLSFAMDVKIFWMTLFKVFTMQSNNNVGVTK
jgi:lipopolysaccharide/colanic/teichoic acid biosynthesis glycosyltransferase